MSLWSNILGIQLNVTSDSTKQKKSEIFDRLLNKISATVARVRIKNILQLNETLNIESFSVRTTHQHSNTKLNPFIDILKLFAMNLCNCNYCMEINVKLLQQFQYIFYCSLEFNQFNHWIFLRLIVCRRFIMLILFI